MKTLDEVINKLECYPVSPSTLPCSVSIVTVEDLTDVLNYLKEYRTVTDICHKHGIASVWGQVLPDPEKTDWDKKLYFDNAYDNDPLDWETLKTMEGKPVWVDPLSTKALHTPGWGLVGKTSFTTWEGVECCSIVKVGVTYALPVGEYGKTWKAYRKERG